MSIPNAQSIIDLFNKREVAQAHSKIRELRKMAVEFRKQNVELKNQVLELREKLYKLESTEGELCPKCQKSAWYIESSKPDPQFGDLGGIRRVYKCYKCGYSETKLVLPK
jgi:uncharacterized coiled-coil DUF342 family protein